MHLSSPHHLLLHTSLPVQGGGGALKQHTESSRTETQTSRIFMSEETRDKQQIIHGRVQCDVLSLTICVSMLVSVYCASMHLKAEVSRVAHNESRKAAAETDK